MRRLLWTLGLLVAGGLLTLGAGSTPNPALAGPRPGAEQAGAVVPAVQEGFEYGDRAATQFALAVPTCVPTGCLWTAVSSDHHSGSYAIHVNDYAGVSDVQLVLNSPVAIPAGATRADLTFWQRYDFDTAAGHYYDGGVLEFSIDGGVTWSDGGALLTAGGYNATLDAGGSANPLAGRAAWGGALAGWAPVQADLLPFRGSNLLFRLRLGTNTGNGQSPLGWWVDDLLLSYQADAPCAPAGWATAAPYPTIMTDAAVAAQGEQIYSFGGLNGSATTAAYRFSPAGNTWTPLAPLPAPRYMAAAASDGTYLYILGGRDAANTPANTVYRYDPLANSYTPLPPLSVGVFQTGAAVLGGRLYRIGGRSPGGLLSSVEAYPLAGGAWSPVAALPQPTAHEAVLALGSYLYLAGGDAGTGIASRKTYRYDPVANAWDDAAIADLPGMRTGTAAGLYNGQWLLAGGVNSAGAYLSSAVAWDPAANRWSSRAQLPRPHGGGSGASAGGAFYIPGGVDEHGYITATMQRYSDAVCPTPTPGPSPTPCPLSFSDVQPTDYFYTPVLYLACHGVISGYGDGTFRPYNQTTRAQMVKIVVLGFGKPIRTPGGGQYTFGDVPPSQPFWSVIETAAADGIVSGYACGAVGEPCDPESRPYFRPNADVTRGQLSKIVVAAAGWLLRNPPQGSFADVLPGTTFYPFVETASCYGVLSGYGCGGPGEPCDPSSRPYFRVGNNATRGQIAKIVYGAVQNPAPCSLVQR